MWSGKSGLATAAARTRPRRQNYKRGCLLYDRDPREFIRRWFPANLIFLRPMWVRIVESIARTAACRWRRSIAPATRLPGHRDRSGSSEAAAETGEYKFASSGSRFPNELDRHRCGRTFTDLSQLEGRSLVKKVPTTPYDLSVCFSKVIEEGAASVGLTMDELLPAIDMIRYSTTML